MEADMKRLCLSKGFLVNTAGRVCKMDEKTRKFYCGRMNEKDFCKIQKFCGECGKINNSIKLGRYKNLLP